MSLLAERDAELATFEAELAVARAALAGNAGERVHNICSTFQSQLWCQVLPAAGAKKAAEVV